MLCPLCQFDNPADVARCRSCGAALKVSDSRATPDALPDGTLLAGAYAVEGVLGQGGFGITYRCHDRMLDRQVAVKEFFPSGCRREQTDVSPSRDLTNANYAEARAQFLAEARVLARCRHMGIVSVYAAFEANQTAYMVMELLHGQSLGQLLTARGGRLSETESLGIIEHIGAALGFVHGLDLLHRDIKPDNIMVCDDGRVMLIDFGTAREFIKDQAQGHTVVVTPGYAPLEQYARQAKRGAFTDIYSLAATLYHLLTGAMPPAASDRAMGVMLRPVREENPNVSANVARAVESGLAMEIARRPQSVDEFLDLLKTPIETEDHLAGEIQVRDTSLPTPDTPDDYWTQRQLSKNAPIKEISKALPYISGSSDDYWTQQQLSKGVSPEQLGVTASSPVAAPPVAASPVKLAPPRTFPVVANSPKAAPVSRGARGNVSVKGDDGSDVAAKVGWLLLASFIGIMAVASFITSSRSSGSRRNNTPTRSQSSTGLRSSSLYSPPLIPANPRQKEEVAAQKAWDALPVLLPNSVETLPHGQNVELKDDPQKSWFALPWRNGVEFSADGKRLATIDSDSVLRVFSLPDRRVVRSFKLDKSYASVQPLFSPDRQTLAVTQLEKFEKGMRTQELRRVEMWDLRTGRSLGAFQVEPSDGNIWPKAVTDDGQLLIQDSPPRVYEDPVSKVKLFRWNPPNGKRTAFPVANETYWNVSASSPDGKEIAVGDGLGYLRWLDLRTGASKASLQNALVQADYKTRFGTNTGSFSGDSDDTILDVRALDYSSNGSWLASRDEVEISVFDSNANLVKALTFEGRKSQALAIAPNGQRVAARGFLPFSSVGNLLWNVKDGNKIRLQAPSEKLIDFCFSDDGKQVSAVLSKGGGFQFVTWNVDASPIATFSHSWTNSITSPPPRPNYPLAQTDKLVAVADGGSVSIRQKNDALVKTLAIGLGEVAAMKLSRDGRFLMIRRDDAEVQLWDVKTGKLVFSDDKSSSFRESTQEIAFSPDGNLLAFTQLRNASSQSQTVELWSIKDKPRLLRSFEQKKEMVSALTFSPDNKALICGGDRGMLQWIDVATRQLKDSVRVGKSIAEIAFASQSLLVMGESGTTKLTVKTAAKKPLQSASRVPFPAAPDVKRGRLAPSAISVDGKLLAMTQRNGDIQIWQLPAGVMLQELAKNGDPFSSVHDLVFSADGTELTAVVGQTRMRRTVVTNYKRAKAQ